VAGFHAVQAKPVGDVVNQEHQVFLVNCDTSAAKGLSEYQCAKSQYCPT